MYHNIDIKMTFYNTLICHKQLRSKFKFGDAMRFKNFHLEHFPLNKASREKISEARGPNDERRSSPRRGGEISLGFHQGSACRSTDKRLSQRRSSQDGVTTWSSGKARKERRSRGRLLDIESDNIISSTINLYKPNSITNPSSIVYHLSRNKHLIIRYNIVTLIVEYVYLGVIESINVSHSLLSMSKTKFPLGSDSLTMLVIMLRS